MSQPESLHSITRPAGFHAAGGTCGIKASGKADLAMIVSDRPARLAAVYTTNRVVGAPVIVGRRHLRGGRGRAFVCNSGCANVATGEQGIADAIAMCQAAAEAIGCDPHDVLPASTGVIGHRLPIDRIERGIGQLAPHLDRGEQADAYAARAIMTTDLKPKAAWAKVAGSRAVVAGIAKGSGMIAPDMATMLGFITSDANIGAALLRRALKAAVNADASFNRISVDTDTSTSDTVAVLANGAADGPAIRETGPAYDAFAAALTQVCRSLAYQVIADGEGAKHVIRARVKAAASDREALAAARAIADSPLVKTAVHGADPNWGRIAMAVGKSGARVDPAKMTIRIGRTTVYRNAGPAKFDQAAASRQMQAAEVLIEVDLGQGPGDCEFLGCDLSREYITINADYTT